MVAARRGYPQIAEAAPKIVVRDLSVFYGEKQALFGVNLDVPAHQVTALIGPSGCGKSTFIRCLNRMNDVIEDCRVEGKITLDGVDVNDRRVDVVKLRARVGMVFQKPNPFPKSIYDNVAYGPRIHGLVLNRAETNDVVDWALQKAGLFDEVKERLSEPGTSLSGGQQQRLCIARAIAVSPEVILMDEPCSALDPIATAKIEELMDELRRNFTIIIVTHNMQQAARVSQRYRVLPPGLPGGGGRDGAHLHQPARLAHPGLHHRPVRLAASASSRRLLRSGRDARWSLARRMRAELRKTKVVATIGPASDSLDIVKGMIDAGLNVARLNLSHGTHAEHAARVARVRRAADELGANVAIMADARGIEIRTGPVAGGAVELASGARFCLWTDGRPGSAEGVSVTHPGLPGEVGRGSRILLDEGNLELRVTAVVDRVIQCEVVQGGRLEAARHVNLPDASLRLSPLSRENREDLLFAAEQGVDYVAASFVRDERDVRAIQALLDGAGAPIPVIAKIESREGVENLDAIVEAAAGTMVARGDLGVELPLAEVPLIQKRIIRTTVRNGKPVITATQMLESMLHHPRPTRAEASDVANAILDGTSAVLLAGETAVGRYPVLAVRTMSELALRAEASLGEYGGLQHILPEPSNVVTEAVSQAAITMAHHLDAAAIVTLTESGFTSRTISKYRPRCPIVAVTRSPEVVRRLALNWGVVAIRYAGEHTDDDARVAFAFDALKERGFARTGDVVVVTAGIAQATGSTNRIRVVTVPA